VTVAFLDETGTRMRKDFVGLWATSLQHQIDHLNGKMYFDNLSQVKRKMLIAKAKKLAKRS
jgi:peptide deformylase